MRCRKGFRNVNISNGLIIFERCSIITATGCAQFFHNCIIVRAACDSNKRIKD